MGLAVRVTANQQQVHESWHSYGRRAQEGMQCCWYMTVLSTMCLVVKMGMSTCPGLYSLGACYLLVHIPYWGVLLWWTRQRIQREYNFSDNCALLVIDSAKY